MSVCRLGENVERKVEGTWSLQIGTWWFKITFKFHISILIQVFFPLEKLFLFIPNYDPVTGKSYISNKFFHTSTHQAFSVNTVVYCFVLYSIKAYNYIFQHCYMPFQIYQPVLDFLWQVMERKLEIILVLQVRIDIYNLLTSLIL